MSQPSSRVARIAPWTGSAAAAAAVGALVGGAVDALAADGPITTVGTLGYGALFVWPALTLLVMAGRGLWWGWKPGAVAAALTDEHGSAPRLAGWLGFLLLAVFVLSWATFNAVRLLATWTTFKPTVVAVGMPPAVIGIALILLACSRPAVAVLTRIAANLDRRARARFGRSPFTPRVLIAVTAALALGLLAFGWFVSVSPRIGYLELGILRHPVVAILVAIGANLGLARVPRLPRRIASVAAVAIVVSCAGFALWMRTGRPLGVLEIWSRSTVASEVVEQLYYLEDLREDIAFLVEPPALRPGAAPRDIVLITIDTVRADHTPLGGGKAEMPVLAKLGAEGAVFTSAYSPGNVTRRSIPSIATGVSPTRVRGKVAGWALRLDPRHILLAERFRAAGYDTAGFFCCASFWSSQHRLGINRGIDHLVIEPDGAVLSEATRAWLVKRRATSPDKPLFLWVHFIEPHNWLQGRNDLRSPTDRKAQYDKVLGEVDDHIGTVLAAFTGMGGRAPIVAVSADHGEGLGDHGQPYHSTDLHDSQIHVPLVIAGPGIPPHRVVEPVGLVSLAPTLIDLAGFVPPGMPQMDGTTFAPLVTTTTGGDAIGGYAFAAMIRDRSAPTASRAVIRGTWKLIETPRGFELYDRATDPGEARNLVKSRPEKLREMRALLDERRALDGRSPFASP